MSSKFNPWNPALTVEAPFASLLAEARAALDRPGADVAAIKRKYHAAVAAGASHLDVPPTIEAVVRALDASDIDALDYDDGPFAEGMQVSPMEVQPETKTETMRSSQRPGRTKPPPLPKATPIDHMRRLLRSTGTNS